MANKDSVEGSARAEMRQRILEIAMAQIDAGGESSVRLRSVAAEAGIALPSLYHYFANREELISGAHADRYQRDLAHTLDPFLAAYKVCETRDEFIVALRGLYTNSFRLERIAARAARAETVGRSFHDSSLRTAVIETMRDSLAGGIAAMTDAQGRGWIRSDIDAEAFTYWHLAHISSAVFPEALGDPALMEKWTRVTVEAMVAFVLSEPAAD